MDMKLGHGLSIKQHQQLVITPELIESIQILQFNIKELNDYIDEQLLSNPVLEQSQDVLDSELPMAEEYDPELDVDWKQFLNDRQYDDISYKQSQLNHSSEKDNTYEQYVTSEMTLTEHLEFQMDVAVSDKKQRQIGYYIIENLDENGYMSYSLEEIAEALNVSVEETAAVLKVIQTFDPYGVGARTINECLLIQVDLMGKRSPELDILINEHLDDLALKRINHIIRKMRISNEQLADMVNLIKTLDPKPGRLFNSQEETKYVIPDILVEQDDDEFKVVINEANTPELVLSSYYQSLLKDPDCDPEIAAYLQDKLKSAMWLIKSINQRRDTIHKVSQAVVTYQQDFFKYGTKHLKVLTMKQIADEVGVHESTVSRSISGKYLQSAKGIFEMKYFFSAGLAAKNLSYESVKVYIREIIDTEDPKSPYSDQMISEILKEKNMNISRRTVAKYREEIGILSSSKRRNK